MGTFLRSPSSKGIRISSSRHFRYNADLSNASFSISSFYSQMWSVNFIFVEVSATYASRNLLQCLIKDLRRLQRGFLNLVNNFALLI